MTALDYLAHLRSESHRFAEVLRTAPDVQVPTCPDWRTDDLIWHLAEVQWFWGTVVRTAVDDPEGLQHPDRPSDRDGLIAFFDAVSADLSTALAEVDPAEPRWTWSRDRTAGFIRRRQAHEALIHRVDAELTANEPRRPMDPGLSTDGVDEALRVMFGGVPDWGSTEPEPEATVLLRTSDTGASWLVTLGRFRGTAPDGTVYDEPDIVVAPGGAEPASRTAATVAGSAADLDCWLWGRPPVAELERSGDADVLARLQEVLAQGVQ